LHEAFWNDSQAKLYIPSPVCFSLFCHERKSVIRLLVLWSLGRYTGIACLVSVHYDALKTIHLEHCQKIKISDTTSDVFFLQQIKLVYRYDYLLIKQDVHLIHFNAYRIKMTRFVLLSSMHTTKHQLNIPFQSESARITIHLGNVRNNSGRGLALELSRRLDTERDDLGVSWLALVGSDSLLVHAGHVNLGEERHVAKSARSLVGGVGEDDRIGESSLTKVDGDLVVLEHQVGKDLEVRRKSLDGVVLGASEDLVVDTSSNTLVVVTNGELAERVNAGVEALVEHIEDLDDEGVAGGRLALSESIKSTADVVTVVLVLLLGAVVDTLSLLSVLHHLTEALVHGDSLVVSGLIVTISSSEKLLDDSLDLLLLRQSASRASKASLNGLTDISGESEDGLGSAAVAASLLRVLVTGDAAETFGVGSGGSSAAHVELELSVGGELAVGRCLHLNRGLEEDRFDILSGDFGLLLLIHVHLLLGFLIDLDIGVSLDKGEGRLVLDEVVALLGGRSHRLAINAVQESLEGRESSLTSAGVAAGGHSESERCGGGSSHSLLTSLEERGVERVGVADTETRADIAALGIRRGKGARGEGLQNSGSTLTSRLRLHGLGGFTEGIVNEVDGIL